MAIKGLTNKGLDFPQIGRIKKGELIPVQGKPGVTRPVDLDYFKVEFADNAEGAALAAVFVKVYGAEPKSINIRLPFNDIENMWDGFLEAYTASRLLAKSDGPTEEGGIVLYRCDGKTGEVLVRNGENIQTGKQEPHPANNIAGQDYNGKPVEYNPIGRLKVIVPELKEAAYMLFTTGSWNDIRFISQQLAGLKELNNGVIKGVPLKLIRSNHEVMVPIDGVKKRMTKSLISIKADPDWVAARMEEDKQLAFPKSVAAKMLEPGEMIEETEIQSLSDLTHPDQWVTNNPGETVAETVIDAPESKQSAAEADKSSRSPHSPENLKKNIAATILKYDALLEQDGAKYQVSVEHDGAIVASVIDSYVGGLQKSSSSRYAIFTFLLGEGKGSTKNWTAQETGTIKNIWLKITQFGEVLGEVEEEELRMLWNFVQAGQGQTDLFS